jgi:hypothetical protein
LHAWVMVTEIVKRTEELLQVVRPAPGGGEHFMRTWRCLVAFLAVARTIGKYSYSVSELLKFDVKALTSELIYEVWELILVEMAPGYKGTAGKKSAFVAACCTRAAIDFGITGVEVVGRRSLPSDEQTETRKVTADFNRRPHALSSHFLDRVDAALPAQPWKPGVHHQVAGQLGCAPADVGVAIARLIELGRRNRQIDGVVYARDGSILAVDPDRESGS